MHQSEPDTQFCSISFRSVPHGQLENETSCDDMDDMRESMEKSLQTSAVDVTGCFSWMMYDTSCRYLTDKSNNRTIEIFNLV